MPRTRKFGDKRYQFVKHWSRKADALQYKRRVKKSYGGGYVRIIPDKTGYNVWVRIK